MAIVILLAVIPSFFLAWQSVRESDLKERYDQFISHELDFDNTQVVKSEIDTSQKILRVAMIGSVLDNSKLDRV